MSELKLHSINFFGITQQKGVIRYQLGIELNTPQLQVFHDDH